jgi:maleylpyruvate isomerase
MTTDPASPAGAADPASPADAASRAAELNAGLEAATGRLLETTAGLSDQQAREPSLLPGWSRGHVLTHLARNADGLRNLLVWARTGVETPQYVSQEAREEGIQAGAGRPAAELLDDLGHASARFAVEASTLTGDDWLVPVGGQLHPAWYTLWRRLTEVEIHHVDLNAGYRPADWPAEFAAESLERVSVAFQRPDSPAAVLRSTDSGRRYRIGPASRADRGDTEQASALEVSGPDRLLVAWLTGRSSGAGLGTDPAGPLPVLPAW